MIARFDFAPLDGITKRVFRRVWHKHFGGADRYFVPFISPTDQHVITPRDRRELEMQIIHDQDLLDEHIGTASCRV